MKTTFHLYGDLPNLLRRRWKKSGSIILHMNRRASVKDVLESCGLPHTEVGSIERLGREVDFNLIIANESVFHVHPVPVPWNISEPTLLRPNGLQTLAFIVDVNAGRLARYLRAAGFDTLYDYRWDDNYLADLAGREKRMLLTRDRGLLMRRQVEFGRYIRAEKPVEQLGEVMDLFGIGGNIQPFTRCLECNSLLEPITRDAILHRLEPLTRKYYTTFSVCKLCDKIYWPGSHLEKMRSLFSAQAEF